jgi:surface antigen
MTLKLIKTAAFAATLGLAVIPAAPAQDPSLGQAAVGAEAGSYLGLTFSVLPQYRQGQGALVGGLAGAVLGTLAAVPVGQEQTVMPGPAQPPGLQQECRNFTNTVTIDGEKRELKGTACKQPDGTWRNVP